MLSAAQLTSLQGFATKTLDLTANTQRNTGSGTDALGIQLETWTPVLTGVACGMAEPSTKDMQLYAGAILGSERAVKLSFPIGSDVKRNDRVAVNGRTYRVQVDTSGDSYNTLVQVIAVQINEAVE